MSAEQKRIDDNYANKSNWLQWGPYLSERQWGTVREDYSNNGDAWNYITHDMSRSKAYRWGEDGIGGFCDDQQQLCISLALWNAKDAILKERLFGLTNSEGNHGEDVKELYYYLDSTPTHSYNKMLYKYPQAVFPYKQLLEENKQRGKSQPEYELLDTSIFDNNNYFDVFIEFAKAEADDVLIKYTVYNRSSTEATLHILPQLWFRNTWSWSEESAPPDISIVDKNTLMLQSKNLEDYFCYFETDAQVLFTNNETNNERLYHSANTSAFVKDGIHRRVVEGDKSAVNDQNEGSKVALWYEANIAAHDVLQLRLRLTRVKNASPFNNFDNIITQRISEADEFYEAKQSATSNDDEKLVQRQAWAGLLWSKQYYDYNVLVWLNGDPQNPPPPKGHKEVRNKRWKHFVSANVMSMPDKWEYPWFAAWDLAFHCIAFSSIDPEFAKSQLLLLVTANFQHPSGQLPAYEWDFGDVNPPVHALAAWHVYQADCRCKGKPDYAFLEEIFQKLLLNFTWWVNQKDSEGNNIFEGGFLGLDNIGVFNRSAPVPGGGFLEQADGTSWVAMFAVNMMQIAIELAVHNSVYETMAVKFSEHFLYIAQSISKMGDESVGLWDDEDGFYYDLLRKPDGDWDRLRLRTLVGLLPMIATIIFDEGKWKNLPLLKERMDWFREERPDLAELVSYWKDKKGNEQHLLSLLRGHRMKLLLKRMLDPKEFLSDYGIRSVSKVYKDHPFKYWLNGHDYSVTYLPAESDSNMFGGNSNWRGPIWMPVNFLLVEALNRFHEYYTDEFRVEYPTYSGQYHSLAEIASAISQRLKNIFLRDENGNRPVFGDNVKLNTDPHFKDYILFHEYFNGDNGKGLGASHQTGWTALVAVLC